jgi:hypothetical protein
LLGLEDVLDCVIGGELVEEDEDFVKIVGLYVGEGVDLFGFANF